MGIFLTMCGTAGGAAYTAAEALSVPAPTLKMTWRHISWRPVLSLRYCYNVLL